MRRRLFGLSLIVLFSCAAPDVGGPDSGVDGGELDAGDDADAGLVCEEGQVPGPLGTCVDAPCSQAGGTCLSGSGCCNGMTCRGPLDPFGCGMCQRAFIECDGERPCEEGFTCVVVPPPTCSCDGESGTACAPTCTEGSCGDDESCRDHWCQPRLCTEGFTCPPGSTCAAGERADRRGCSPIDCTRSSTCPNDAPRCVNGRCQPDVGSCMLPVP